MKAHEAEIEQLIQHIQLNGPVRAADFEHPQKERPAGGNGNRINAILKGYLQQAKSWWLKGVNFSEYMI